MSALSDKFASLSPGQMTELSVNNLLPPLQDPGGGATGSILAFTNGAPWDPVNRKLIHASGDHHAPSNGQQVMEYSESDNTMRRLAKPTWLQSALTHSNDHSVTDGQGNWWYFTGDKMVKTNIASGAVQIFNLNVGGNIAGVAYFPEMSGFIIFYNTNVRIWRETTGFGANLADGLENVGDYHNFCQYCPVHKVVILGGGQRFFSDTNTAVSYKGMYRVNSAGQVTPLKDAPHVLDMGFSLECADPVTGDLVVWFANGTVYSLNPTANAWTQHDAGKSALLFADPYFGSAVNLTCVAMCSTYGGIIFVKHRPDEGYAKFILYKHAAGSTPPPSLTKVDKYRIFERSVTNINSYTNKFDYTEIELRTRFVAPSGKVVTFFGFYDGDGAGAQTGNVWKMRFMPDEAGIWNYTYTWSDGTPGGSGQFECTEGTFRGPLKVATDNTQFLMDARGAKFDARPYGFHHYLGFTTTGSIVTEINNLKTVVTNEIINKGYNLVMFQNNGDRARTGKSVSEDGGRTVESWWEDDTDTKVFDCAVFAKYEEALTHCAVSGVYCFPFELIKQGTLPALADLPIFQKYFLARIAPYYNFLGYSIVHEWMDAGAFNATPADANTAMQFFYDNHPWKPLMYLHDMSYSGFGAWQTAGVTGRQATSRTVFQGNGRQVGQEQFADASGAGGVRNDMVNKPIIGSEDLWESPVADEFAGWTMPRNGAETRQATWGVMMANVLPMFHEWHIWAPTPSGSPLSGTGNEADVKRMFDFFYTKTKYRSYAQLNGLVSSGAGQICSGIAGEEYVVFDAGGGSITIDLTAVPAATAFSVLWFDPTDSTETVAADTTGGGNRTLNSPFGGDSVLFLKKKPTTTTAGVPSEADELAAYVRRGLTLAPGATNHPPSNPSYTVTDGAVAIHDDTETDDTWLNLMMYLRSGKTVYLERFTAWANYHRDVHRDTNDYIEEKTQRLLDHMVGYGLVAAYQFTGDVSYLTAAELYGGDVEAFYAGATPGTYRITEWNHRGVGRHWRLALALVAATGKQRWITLRDKIRNLFVQSPDFDAGFGVSWLGQHDTDAIQGEGAYNNGARIVSTFQLGIIAESMAQHYIQTGFSDTGVRDTLKELARFVSEAGVDSATGYVGEYITNGRGLNGATARHRRVGDPTPSTGTVNVLVYGYKITGLNKYLDDAWRNFLAGNGGDPGTGARLVGANTVHHLSNTRLQTSSGNFYFEWNKDESYTWPLYENGGNIPLWGDVIEPPPPPPPPPEPPAVDETRVSSTHSAYSATAKDKLFDGDISNPSGLQASTWASVSTGVEHWVERELVDPITVNRFRFYWAFNTVQNKFMTCQTVDVYEWVNDAWSLLGTATRPGADVEFTDATFDETTNNKFRFVVPAGQANPTYGAMWLVEIKPEHLVDATVTIDITSPAEGAVFEYADTVTIDVSVTNYTGTVEFFVDGVSIGTDPGASYTFDFENGDIGSHVLEAKAGTVTSTPVNISIRDTTEPSAPGTPKIVETLIPVYLVIEFAASTDNHGVAGYNIFFGLAGETLESVKVVLPGVDYANDDDPIRIPIQLLVPNDGLIRQFRVDAFDHFGNGEASAVIDFTLNRLAGM